METTPALDTALNSDRARIFLAGEVITPSRTVRLLESSGEVTWSRGTFKGEDDVFGSLSALETLSDGIGDQAPQIMIKLNPPSDAEVFEICSPDMQGSELRIWLGALDANGAVIVDPLLMFFGELDVPTLTVDAGERELEFECVSGFEKMFRDEEGNRLSPTHHKEVWPTETGLDSVTGIVRQLVWGPGEKIGGSAGGKIWIFKQ